MILLPYNSLYSLSDQEEICWICFKMNEYTVEFFQEIESKRCILFKVCELAFSRASINFRRLKMDVVLKCEMIQTWPRTTLFLLASLLGSTKLGY